MRSVDIANMFVEGCGGSFALTNLGLNRLVYFAQVESLRDGRGPLFDDCIEAWECGPVEPMVYRAFESCGRSPIEGPCEAVPQDNGAREVVRRVAETYGRLSSFDLIMVSRRGGGAWRGAYDPECNREITLQDIERSADMDGFESIGETFSQKAESVMAALPNTLRLLQNS